MDPKTTRELTNILENIHNEHELKAYMEKPGHLSPASSFLCYFQNLPEVQTMDEAELIRKSGIERTYGYQILNGRRAPGRDKIIALCLAAGVALKETQRSLEAAGLAPLYSRSRRDAVLIYCVNRHFSVIETSEVLERFGEKPL